MSTLSTTTLTHLTSYGALITVLLSADWATGTSALLAYPYLICVVYLLYRDGYRRLDNHMRREEATAARTATPDMGD